MKRKVLNATQVDQFVEDGYVHLPGAVSPDVVAAGREVIWADLERSPDDPSSWDTPVVRLVPSDRRPFARAAGDERLHRAWDQLVGTGRWLGRPDLGYFVVRFPHPDDPGDTGWHIDGSFPPEGDVSAPDDFSQWRVNLCSRGRALLMLFLFSDVGTDDGPTRIRVGSHLDVTTVLRNSGPEGMNAREVSARADRLSSDRPVALATGGAGDVYLCHPFLVHGAQPVRGRSPRLMAQPPLASREPCVLDRPDGYSPVEDAIRRGLRIER
jgi:hypothetical protein